MASLHPNVEQMMKHFNYQHLPPSLRDVSQKFSDLAEDMVESLDDSDPQVLMGLHDLLRAKDCFVRAAASGSVTTHSTPAQAKAKSASKD